MTQRKTYFTFILLFYCCLAFAQSGSIKGTIKDTKTNEAVIGANVVIKGTTQGASTDIDGNFLIPNVKPGTYSIIVSYISYKSNTIDGIIVAAGKPTVINSSLEEDLAQLNTVVVTGVRQTNSDLAVLSSIKLSDQVVSGISSEQITKSQDRDASEVVKRIPGVTIMNNRFVMVRGLSERYNSVMLNDALTTSTETDSRAFSFDLIPSGMIDRLLIYKTGSPELPGEFSGGVIKIFTKGMPDANTFNVTVSSAYRAGTTFNNFVSTKKSGTDFLGFDNGSRALPKWFPSDLSTVSNKTAAAAGRSLNDNWAPISSNASPDLRLAINLTKRFDINNVKIGNITSLNYSNTNTSYTAQRNNFDNYDAAADKHDTTVRFTDKQYNNNVRIGLIHNWAVYLNQNHKFEIRNLFNQLSANETTIRTGVDEADQDVKNYSYRYESRSIYSGQLQGTHSFFEKLSFKWIAGVSLSNRNEPDFRRVRTFKPLGTSDEVPRNLIIAPSASLLDAGRFFSKLNENSVMGSGDLEYILKKGNSSEFDTKIRAGYYLENKERNFSARWTTFKAANSSTFDYSLLSQPISTVFSAKNINDTNGFILTEGTGPSDKYSAKNNLVASYVSAFIPFKEKVKVSLGVRAENNRRQVIALKSGGGDASIDATTFNLLPSINTSYNFNPKALVRVAYGRTLNRPEFREQAAYNYYDFATNSTVEGNANLKTAIIDNLDLRFELYPKSGETISFGVFYKQFQNPIETRLKQSFGGGTRGFTFENAMQAKNAGVEFDMRKSLQELTTNRFIGNISLLFNASLIKSEVAFEPGVTVQDRKRPMMGQSPYIINTGLYYNDVETNLQVNLLYNVIGKRVFAVGSYGTGIPNIYEMPRNVLDLTVSKTFGKKLEVKAGVQDILNNKVLLVQDVDWNGKIDQKIDEQIVSYRRGPYYSLGVKYNIF